MPAAGYAEQARLTGAKSWSAVSAWLRHETQPVHLDVFRAGRGRTYILMDDHASGEDFAQMLGESRLA